MALPYIVRIVLLNMMRFILLVLENKFPSAETRVKFERISIGAFNIFGCLVLLMAYGAFLVSTGTPPGGVGFFIYMPMMPVLIPTFILGPILSLFIWRSPHLNFVKVFSVFIISGLVVFEHHEYFVIFFGFLYGVVCLALGTKVLGKLIGFIGFGGGK